MKKALAIFTLVIFGTAIVFLFTSWKYKDYGFWISMVLGAFSTLLFLNFKQNYISCNIKQIPTTKPKRNQS